MKVYIELENEQERVLAKDKIDEVERIFEKNVQIIYAEKGKRDLGIFEKIDRLSWDMGKKLYKTRDELHACLPRGFETAPV